MSETYRIDPLTAEEVAGGIFVWVDKETTGLDSRADDILELGIKVTTIDLRVLCERYWIVCPPVGWRDRLEKIPDVKKMHEESGLLNAVTEIEEYELDVRMNNGGNTSLVSYMAWNWLTNQLQLKPGVYPMVGSNVANFDRRFAEDKMPIFNAFFHYRNIDVSTIKELCKVYRPDVYARLPQPGKKDHRALADIDWSIKELKYYVENFFDLGILEDLSF